MNTLRAFQTALRSLTANWGRSLLTILGIVIGVAAIVLVMALGQGAQELILQEVRGVGANFIDITPGRQSGNMTDMYSTLYSDSIKDRDVKALLNKSNVPGLSSVSPALVLPSAVSYLDAVYRPVVMGWTTKELEEMIGIAPAEGELISEEDITQRAKIVVIGSRVREKLFGESDAVGKLVTIKGQKVRVVGVMPPYGSVLGMNLDDLAILPYSTVQKDFLGWDYYQELHARATDGVDVEQVAEDIRATLRESHNITDPSKDDFTVMTQKDITKRISTVTQVLTIFLVMVASISLVVGGIGIMNIMLVSVTERTREIGLRKAVGAQNKDIMQQFLLEAVMLTVSGGAIGTSIAIGISFLVAVIARQQFKLDWPFQIPVSALIIGLGMAAVVGIAFGLYPARQAARKSPIDALRYE